MPKEYLDLDEKDRMIISLLKDRPDISQSEIAGKVGISQPSVGVRLRKLKSKGAVSFLIGMNFKKVDLYLAKVDLTAKNTAKVLDSFKGCPYFLNGLIVSGKNNLCLFLVGEDISTLEAIVDRHLRSNPCAADVEMNVIIASSDDLVFPVRMTFNTHYNPPCGSEGKCDSCSYYESERCLGCPITGHYRGTFW
ncbi:MAG TPA: Lrp/AsnC family transcriptional regulator [Euryarchaeota archaeon]|nr:Lrp/AsnC family transcriptional regulator [Euryarchaeota archaeon]